MKRKITFFILSYAILLFLFSFIKITIINSNDSSVITAFWTAAISFGVLMLDKGIDDLSKTKKELELKNLYLSERNYYLEAFLIEIRNYGICRNRRDDTVTIVQEMIEKVKAYINLIDKIDLWYLDHKDIESLIELRKNISLTIAYLEVRKQAFTGDGGPDKFKKLHEHDNIVEILTIYGVSLTDTNEEIRRAIREYLKGKR